MKKVAIYARVSTTLKQDPNLQLVPLRAMAEGRGFEIHKEYVDYISGTKSQRKELDNLIREARMGKFKVVLIYALDREILESWGLRVQS